MAEERISELEDISVETFKTGKHREQRLKIITRRNYLRNVRQPQKCNIYMMGIPEREEMWKGAEEIFAMIENFPK